MAAKVVGIVGVGNVGGRMAKDLVAAGYKVLVRDNSAEAVQRAVTNGAEAVEDLSAMVAGTETILLSLPNSDVVEAVIKGEGGLLQLMNGGQILVDMSTSLPSRTIALYPLLADKGIRFLDAPISFGPHGMDIMVGGDEALFYEVYPIFDIVGHKTTLVGPVSHGHYTKLVQNMISGVNIAVVAEGLAFAAKAGLDVNKVWEAIRTTGAGVAQVERTYPRMVRREFGEGGQLALHTKDMGYVLKTGEEIGAVTPFSAALLDVFKHALEEGDPRWSQVSCITYFENRMGQKVQAPEDKSGGAT